MLPIRVSHNGRRTWTIDTYEQRNDEGHWSWIVFHETRERASIELFLDQLLFFLLQNMYGCLDTWSPPRLCSVYVSRMCTLEGAKKERDERWNSRSRPVTTGNETGRKADREWESHIQMPTLTLIPLCTKNTPGKMRRSSLSRHRSTRPVVFRLTKDTYQMNSEHIEQNVGWRKKVAMNLCPLIS